MPPQVRELQSLIAEYGKAYDPQRALIDADITANANAGAAQEAGLMAKKDQAFKGIEQRAQNKGMYFSGFSPDEQANYTSDTYLPALAQLQATIAATRSQLLGKKADIETDVYNKAFNTREGDIKAKNDWQSEQERRAWQAEQDRINREFQAAENAKSRSAQAASSRASAGPSLSLRKNSAGGYDVLEDGQVSKNYDLASYAQLTGKDLINLLANGDARDRQAAQWYNDNIRLGRGQAYALDRLMNYDRPTAFYLGGGYGS
jgi:hypothetical protein